MNRHRSAHVLRLVNLVGNLLPLPYRTATIKAAIQKSTWTSASLEMSYKQAWDPTLKSRTGSAGLNHPQVLPLQLMWFVKAIISATVTTRRRQNRFSRWYGKYMSLAPQQRFAPKMVPADSTHLVVNGLHKTRWELPRRYPRRTSPGFNR